MTTHGPAAARLTAPAGNGIRGAGRSALSQNVSLLTSWSTRLLGLDGAADHGETTLHRLAVLRASGSYEVLQ